MHPPIYVSPSDPVFRGNIPNSPSRSAVRVGPLRLYYLYRASQEDLADSRVHAVSHQCSSRLTIITIPV